MARNFNVPSAPKVSTKIHGRRPPPPPPHSSRHRGGKGKSSSSVSGPVATLVYGLAAFAVAVPLGLAAFLLHGHGVI